MYVLCKNRFLSESASEQSGSNLVIRNETIVIITMFVKTQKTT